VTSIQHLSHMDLKICAKDQLAKKFNKASLGYDVEVHAATIAKIIENGSTYGSRHDVHKFPNVSTR
jgi:hypothetical protein